MRYFYLFLDYVLCFEVARHLEWYYCQLLLPTATFQSSYIPRGTLSSPFSLSVRRAGFLSRIPYPRAACRCAPLARGYSYCVLRTPTLIVLPTVG
jgi:hypothetical protein